MPNEPTPPGVTLAPCFAPEAIEARSFAIIDAECPEPRPFAGARWEIVRRMIHTTADFDMLALARFHPQAVDAGLAALRRGCEVFTDTEMARCGIPLRRMEPLGCRVTCFMNDPDVVARAKAEGITRATAAMDLAGDRLDGAIVVVGNAPTALLRLLERLDAAPDGRPAPRPALVVGMPVGFVNAAESKELLMARTDIPSIAVAGRKGGSALAACVVNALAAMVLRERA
ncbi:MAG: precorrin-8X methylmutase [Desulfovibrionaceae bacterium]